MTYDEKGSLIGFGNPTPTMLPFSGAFTVPDLQQFVGLAQGVEVAEYIFQTLTLTLKLPVRITSAVGLAIRQLATLDLPVRRTAGVDLEL